MAVTEPWNWLVILALVLLVFSPSLSRWWRKRPAKDLPDGSPYKVYTKDFDVEVRAVEIAERLSDISKDHLKYWRPTEDPEWLEAIAAADRKVTEIAAASFFSDLPQDLSDVVVALLVDHSGSMRGNPISAVASTVKVASDALVRRKAKVEVLGFTTAGWRGGFARSKWVSENRPRYPGRLCALMHIIYKTADDEGLDDAAFRNMLNAGTLYENIDGEALEWAEQRLLKRPEKHKILVVFSDGAPVDDSTLVQNGPSILYRHITTVIGRLESNKAIDLAAVGVNFRVDQYYSKSASAEDISQLPLVTANLIKSLLAK